jgi:hypothetical protein
VAGPDGDSDHVERVGIDGHRNTRTPGAAGLGRMFTQQTTFKEFGHVATDGVGAKFGSLVQLPATERSFVAKNSQNFALLERQDRLFITDHDRK